MPKHITVVSETFDPDIMKELLKTERLFFGDAHVLYPADCDGSHLTRFFMVEKILSGENDFSSFIALDIYNWIRREKIDFDFVFAPAQPGVKEIAKIIAREFKKQYALWDYFPTGRFGDMAAKDSPPMIPFGRALMFNGMSAQGRCIGDRLPSFLKRCQAYPVAAAVFAKGTTGLVNKVEETFGSRFYSTIQVDIPVYTRGTCPKCKSGDVASLQRWTDLQ
ncbi:MAG: hypothetical protein Q8O83_02600 [bacterium]|nr:hypothetical protein [bacterium]